MLDGKYWYNHMQDFTSLKINDVKFMHLLIYETVFFIKEYYSALINLKN